MNKAFVVLVAILSLTTAAAPKEEPFSVASFFEGSWIIAKRTISLDSGDVIGETELILWRRIPSAEVWTRIRLS